MTDQLNIDATNSVRIMIRPASVDSWKAKNSPSAARKCGRSNVGMRLARHSRTCRAACKILAAVTAILNVSTLHADDGQPYDVFAKALAPIASAVFGATAGQPGALVAECQVAEATGPLAPARGTRFRLALQAPDRMRVDVIRTNEKLTACRNGTELWAVPAESMRTLAQAAGLPTSPATDSAATPLVPLALNPQMLAFLPAVFDVKDLGMENGHRILQFGLLPEIQQSIQAEAFTGRAWIGDDYRPARIVIDGPGFSLDIRIDKLGYAEQLAATAWQPDAGQDALRLPASALNGLFENMLSAKIPGS